MRDETIVVCYKILYVVTKCHGRVWNISASYLWCCTEHFGTLNLLHTNESTDICNSL